MRRALSRGLIPLAALVVVLLSSRPADAQVYGVPGPPRQHGGMFHALATGSWYEMMAQKHAERRIQRLQTRLGGDPAAAGCDINRIDNLRFSIMVDSMVIGMTSSPEYGYCRHPGHP